MNYEKLRLKVGHLLLGKKRTAKFVVIFPKLLFLLQVALWGAGVYNAAMFERGEYGLALSAVFAVTSILLYFLTASFHLLRDRWLFCSMGKHKKKLSTLLIEFSFADFLLAVKLNVFLRVRCVLRAVLFLAFPVAVCVYCFELAGFEMTRTKWLVCIAGCSLLLGLGAFFTVASLCSVFTAKRLCCFDIKHTFSSFIFKTAALDSKCFKLLNFRLTFYPLFGAKKALAGMIDARMQIRNSNSSMNKL